MHKRKGLLLVEVGIGAMFLAFIMVPAMGVLRSGVSGTAQSVHATRALHAARSVLGAADQLGYDDLSDPALQALVAQVTVPPGVSAPRADLIESVAEKHPDGSWYRAKVYTVRVAWRRTEGKDEKGEVVLRGVTVLSH